MRGGTVRKSVPKCRNSSDRRKRLSHFGAEGLAFLWGRRFRLPTDFFTERRARGVKLLLVFALAALAVNAQQPQNPSPMVRHKRQHQPLAEQPPPAGRREKLDVGTLFLPAGLKNGAPILFFFHGDTWIPEVAAARNRTAA